MSVSVIPRAICAFLLQLALLLCLCCGAAAVAENVPSSLLVEPARVNFGEVRQHQILEAKVKLTNIGKEPISIFSITTSCECTIASSADPIIAPGKDTTLTVKSETRDLTGNVRRVVIVHATSGDMMVPVEMAVAPSALASQAPSQPK